MRTLRVPLVAALVAAAALSAASSYSVRLVPFPTAEVADGRSQITVSAQVLDGGRSVPDGTQVVFETNLGSFRENVVRTSGGWARAILITGGVPGTAKITATATGGGSQPSTCDVEFVKSRSELSQARETIDTTSSGSLTYANDSKILEGVGPDHGVVVRYRDLEISADVLQLDLNAFTLKARKAIVRRGHKSVAYDSLFLNLTSRTGYGVSNYVATRPESIVAYPNGVAFVESLPDGDVVAKSRQRFGIVEVGREADHPLATPLDDDPFQMADISASPSTVGSRKAVVYARREIQFHRADIFVDNAKVLRFPLFVVNLNSTSGSPLVTDDLLSINDNQIALNYPHYLSLKPGLTSLLRLRTGERYGQGLTASRGAFLDYELSWSRGDDNQGGFTFGGVGRGDWVASAQQFWRLSDRTSTNFHVDSPAGRSFFGSGSVNHSFPGYSLSLNGSQSQTFAGPRINAQNYGLSLERNPVKISDTPLHMAYGLTANQSQSSYPLVVSGKTVGSQTESRAGAGFTTRFYSDSIPLDKASSVNGSLTAAKLYGPTAYGGVALHGSLSLTRNFGHGASMFLTYNYLQDGLNEAITGRHSLSLISSLSRGNTSIHLNVSKGIGVDRMNLSADASYNISSLWQLSYSHLYSQYQSQDLTDFYYILGYRIGWRQIGLTWSNKTHRPGIQLMNVNL